MHQSTLAAAAAPPDINRAERTRSNIQASVFGIGAGIIGLGLGAVGYGTVLGFGLVLGVPAVLIAFPAFLYYSSKLSNDEALDRRDRVKYDEWTRSFMCLSCGSIGVAGMPESQPKAAGRQGTPAASKGQPLPMTSANYTRVGDDEVMFMGVGASLLQEQADGGWLYLGHLPKQIKLPQDGSAAGYKIRYVDGRELVGRFSVEREADRREKSLPDTASGADSFIDGLTKLKALKDSGDLSVDEFEALKRSLIKNSV